MGGSPGKSENGIVFGGSKYIKKHQVAKFEVNCAAYSSIVNLKLLITFKGSIQFKNGLRIRIRGEKIQKKNLGVALDFFVNKLLTKNC